MTFCDEIICDEIIFVMKLFVMRLFVMRLFVMRFFCDDGVPVLRGGTYLGQANTCSFRGVGV